MAFGREHRLAMPATTDTANTRQCRVTVSTKLPLLPLSQSPCCMLTTCPSVRMPTKFFGMISTPQSCLY